MKNLVSRGSTLALAASAVFVFATGANAAIIVYTAQLSGPAESPPNASPGTGSATVTIDTVAHTMRVQATFSGLLGNTTAAHIHSATTNPFAGTAGVATTTPTFAGFPLGVTAGSYDNTLDMTLASSYNPAYVTARGSISAAEAALFQSFDTGRAYLNIHSSVFGGGEIRGFLVPGPAAASLFGLAGLMAARRRR